MNIYKLFKIFSNHINIICTAKHQKIPPNRLQQMPHPMDQRHQRYGFF